MLLCYSYPSLPDVNAVNYVKKTWLCTLLCRTYQTIPTSFLTRGLIPFGCILRRLSAIFRFANNFGTSRSFICKLKSKFDVSIDSINSHSRNPHYHPNQSAEDEYTIMIKNFGKYNPKICLIILCVKLRISGYYFGSFSCKTWYQGQSPKISQKDHDFL